MTTRVAVDPHAIASAFAELIRSEPEVESLWFTTDAGGTTFWLHITSTTLNRERVFFEHWTRYAADHPDVTTRLHVINPRFCNETSISEHFVSADAQPVPLQG